MVCINSFELNESDLKLKVWFQSKISWFPIDPVIRWQFRMVRYRAKVIDRSFITGHLTILLQRQTLCCGTCRIICYQNCLLFDNKMMLYFQAVDIHFYWHWDIEQVLQKHDEEETSKLRKHFEKSSLHQSGQSNSFLFF